MEKLTLTIRELSQLIGVSRYSILAHRANLRQCDLLKGLPEPLVSRPRLVWLRADIEAWLESRRTFKPATTETPTTPPARRGPGRPRKAAAQQKGGEQ